MGQLGKELKKSNLPSCFLIIFLKFYQYFISPLIGVNCRFQPTCSEYSIESIKKFGFLKGLYLTFKRLIKCHPLGKSGYDPVQDKKIIKEISVNEIRKVRLEELYKNLPAKLSNYKGDFSNSTKHLALFEGNKVVSCATIFCDQKKKTVQIRGMLTKKKFQKKGYGSSLMKFMIRYLIKEEYKSLWCNSRVSAINFYNKVGFKKNGKVFLKKVLGPHQKLFLKI